MLTDKQEKFAQAVAIDGMNYSDAYRHAYNTSKMTDKSIWDASSKLRSNAEVAQRILKLKESIVSPKIMSAQKRAERLTNLVEESDDPRVMMQAIDLLNKMTGEYVQKVQAEVSSEVNINIELSDDE
jgi:phage terminase small subunit